VGSGSGNSISNNTQALFQNSTFTTTGQGSVTLQATDDSTIVAVGGALSLTIGSTSAPPSVFP
jgi:hypothetical protein